MSRWLFAWLAMEVAYGAMHRLQATKRSASFSAIGRVMRFICEPTADLIVDREAAPFRARDLRHSTTGSVYDAGSEVLVEILAEDWASGLGFRIIPVLKRVSWDAVCRRPVLKPVMAFAPESITAKPVRLGLKLPSEVSPGMYYIEFQNPLRARIVIPIFVCAAAGMPCAGAIIIPTFTIWGYHEAAGFYPGHKRPTLDLLVHRLAKSCLTGWALTFALRVLLKRGFGLSLNQPRWPVNSQLKIDGFYLTNHRWSKWLWDPELSALEGAWNDDIDILIPFFALADRNGDVFRIHSDLDIHRQDTEILNERRWVFIGQESLTTQYWEHLSRFVELGGEVVLWCPQGFGYRQVEYEDATRTLRYVCSRGKRGFWNEKLELAEPPWDEGELLGFRFPSPDSPEATNSHRVQFDRLRFREALRTKSYLIDKGSVYQARVWDGAGWRPGLNWMGGEPFIMVDPAAKITAEFEGACNVIGLGRCRKVSVVSPTFLGALWAFGLIDPVVVEAAYEWAFSSH